ncbi:MAG: bifunctional phosphoribosylaminoimidazolecarboxamide formyltransferase/IMP cyclohydrolase [Pirellulaceae bacterium]|nr:bifunctional phosphoribosylaminoimidazolecarboxamide formyltransferase/IMP cyclohydrolase [Pirellulaceae bacterium]
MDTATQKNALISVSDKSGLARFAQGLVDVGYTIYSTGGTRRHLEEAGISVVDVATYTGFPEMMDGRVKTLHPRVFAGILCRHDRDDDLAALTEHDIRQFNLVVVNLYPFEATVAREGVTLAEAIEQIDIGGPSLVRAAAKNHAYVTIATDPAQYDTILSELRESGSVSPVLRQRLTVEAFSHTSEYDHAITAYLSQQKTDASGGASQTLNLRFQHQADLRYGENPHQAAALYVDSHAAGSTLVSAQQLNGKELSYNNLLDLDSAWNMARSLDDPAAVVIKHNNPCGAACSSSLAEATKAAMAGDPLSAFGSILGMNRKVDAATAEVLAEPGLFVEAIIAPEFDSAAFEILTTKPKWKNNVRLLQIGTATGAAVSKDWRRIDGGLLVQDTDLGDDSENDWKAPTGLQPTDEQMHELRFAWHMVRYVKSNAIVLSKGRSLVGVGAGQTSRVDAVEISIRKAAERAAGAVLASDAFFPFPDSIHEAAEAGIVAIIQPGGSKRDEEVIEACNQREIPMIFTGRRHFRH